MAPLDEIEPGGLPVEACSKVRVPSGLRSGRAPGRERSSSRGGKSGRASLSLGIDEPRGRSLTRDSRDEELTIAKLCQTNLEPSLIINDALVETWIAEDVEDLDAGESWDECASYFIGGLLADAVEDYADEALERCNRDSACEAEEIDSNYDANSDCRDYPDSELIEEEEIGHGSQRSHAEFSLGQSMFSAYVLDMFEMALSGNVSDYFKVVGQGHLPVESVDERGMHLSDQIPQPSSLKPCSRPSFRRRLRPREIQQSESVAMDCLPFTPACSQTSEKRPLEFWAEQLELAAVAEDAFNEMMALSSTFEVQVEDQLGELPECDGIATLPVAPSAPKPQALRPKAFQRSYQHSTQQTPLLTTPRPPSTPKARALAEVVSEQLLIQDSSPLQPDTGSTPLVNCGMYSPRPPASPPVVVPPQGPPPQARMCSLLRQRSPRISSFDAPAKLSRLKVHERTKHRFLSPRSLTEVGSKDAAMSAMSMDLGDEAVAAFHGGRSVSDGGAEHPMRREISNERVSKTSAYEVAGKSRRFLPPIAPTSWGGVEADIGVHSVSWKKCDAI
mmetsp:Transcript_71607/g.113187  ORF Transcript_71607/g.113187 Transcript_71607/m.113187 type:complete len:560 (+) Transcript_71607:63-1742(+)|eukprot:CAMPEP_0169218738 /NCGR_PEP_ID=MMETSP1016-20121227/19597_1 /TAXON_ID=342587 /ORGANISM="Karlodinium micrum, Strain CCMP2283" /LENGTH=559 /DNA_ID=CAMNT_0009296743 /DNA_START=999 /DNA_END=2678 /DNA_ORIENTATION=-